MQQKIEVLHDLRIPSWALCYLVNNDPEGLTDDEITRVNDWCATNHIVEVAPPTYPNCDAYFTAYPEFGDWPCEVYDCDVLAAV